MALLNRIAISNGDKARKAEANIQIAKRDEALVAAWHKQLETEINAKEKPQLKQKNKARG